MRNFDEELKAYSETLGFEASIVEQGSSDWLTMRAGVVSASMADNLLAKLGTAKRYGYMAELVAQVCTGQIPEQINARALQWGKDNEEAARMAYSASTLDHIKEVPFIYKDDSMRFGCSPDGICGNYGLELKAPFASRTYIEFACAGKIKPEYVKQCQFSLWVTGLDYWVFASFDPRMKKNKLHSVVVERDPKIIDQIETAASVFIEDMDKMLAKMGVEFGEQWR